MILKLNRHQHADSITEIITKKFFTSLQVDMDKAEIISQEIQKLGLSIREKALSATLWVLCIPKALCTNPDSNEILYKASSYGRKCECRKEIDIEILEKLQNNIFSQSMSCPCFNNSDGTSENTSI